MLEETSLCFSEDNCPLIWRQFGSALFSLKTIFQCSIFLNFLWRQLYYRYLFFEDNCTSAHEDNCPLVWRQLSTALKTIVNCSFIEKTILLVKTIVPLFAHFAPVSQLFLFLMLESCHLVCRCKFGLQLSSLKKKLGNWCKVRTVQCKMCSVRSLIAKKYSIRMFMKSKFMPAHQITAL